MEQPVSPTPPGFHALTPHIVVDDAAAALAFYEQALGAQELLRMSSPDGAHVLHAEMQIGDSRIMITEECPDRGSLSAKTIGGTPVTLHLYVPDVDQAFAQAVAAGASAVMPPADMFWGDRYGRIQDPFGLVWALATHVRDLTPEEIRVAAAKAFSQ
ncbi:MAG: VOC family protein [Alphaproteobacteria bacterium]|nr:MAG: VOC family protein [Alphaproteobacteria bacterium]